MFQAGVCLSQLLVQSRYFQIQFFLFQTELFFLAFQFFLGQLLFVSEFVHPVKEFSLVLLVIVDQATMLVNKHQLLFRTGHFITQSSDTLRIHSFPGEFVQQVFVHGCQQFIGFLPFGSNGQVNFFLFVTDQGILFLHSLVTFLLLLTYTSFEQMIELFQFRHCPLQATGSLGQLFIQLFQQDTLLLPCLLFPPDFIRFQEPDTLIVLLHTISGLGHILLTGTKHGLMSFPNQG